MPTAVIAKNKKLSQEVKALVAQVVFEVLNDPDFGLRLSPTAKKRLTKVSSKKQTTISFADIKKRYA
jgi:hypothetical protein